MTENTTTAGGTTTDTAPHPASGHLEIPAATPAGPAGLVITVARTAADMHQRLGRMVADDADAVLVENLRVKLNAFAATDPGENDLVVLADELTYGIYPVTFKLPRNYVIVGWLDADGYRHANPACAVPGAEFLADAWSLLNETDTIAFLNRGGAFA